MALVEKIEIFFAKCLMFYKNVNFTMLHKVKMKAFAKMLVIFKILARMSTILQNVLVSNLFGSIHYKNNLRLICRSTFSLCNKR